MIHRFADLEVDEDRREVRVRGKALQLQPRVLEFITYLARNQERVIPKDELLDALWPGVIVAESSLHRAASLARAALADAGLPDAIKNRQRQGYSLSVEESARETDEPAEEPSTPTLKRAIVAYRAGKWDDAIKVFQSVDKIEGLSAGDLQMWAHSAQCAGRPQEAHGPLERAVAAFSASGKKRNAAWAAILLAHLKIEWREPALARGWALRAARLLQDEPPCREKGYLALIEARMAFFANELEQSLEHAAKARDIGSEFCDPDLEALGLVHIGESSLYLGKIKEGLAALDEAGVSVVADELSSWAGGLIYCGVIYSCITRADWHRASQWTEQFTRWGESRGTAGYPGLCRMHRAEVLTVKGELGTAEDEIIEAQESLARQAPWAEGDTWRARGDICLAKGEYDAARKAYERAAELGWECQFNLAMLNLAEGNPAEAARLLGRALAENAWSGRSRRGQTLAYHVVALSRAGRPEEARAALAQLESDPDLTGTTALHALLELARGEVSAASGDMPSAIARLKGAIRSWQGIDAPLAAAEVRCRLACMLAKDGDMDAAGRELGAASLVFTQSGAKGLLKQCDKLRKALAAEKA